MLFKKFLPFILCILAVPFIGQAQITTSSISGSVKNIKGESLAGATITATHVPTGTVYTVSAKKNGNYNIPNMNPGGPYVINATFVGYNKDERIDITLSLGENSVQDFVMLTNSSSLKEVTVSARRSLPAAGKGGTETTVGRDKVANLPTIGRNLQDYIRYVPQAKITASDGGISIAGQNNRYNSFYVDGAANNDRFGLANSGTNGGQTGTSPISMDAIDQFQVVIAPYDASIGNFTGGGINAITRSGTNNFEGSVYYVFRNEKLAGEAPVATLKQGSTTEFERTKLPSFQNKTTGIRFGGPIIKNKLFFFALAEIQRDERPQPFNFANYSGTNNRTSAIDSLSSFLQTKFGYDPGTYLDNPEKIQADRYNAKLDWNINSKNKLSLSYRYNNSFRNNVSASNSTTVNFYNNGYVIPDITNAGSLELKSTLRGGASNRLLLTTTAVKDDRGPIGNPFPNVSITDGSGRSIIFGTEISSTQNLLNQTNYALSDAYKFTAGKHTVTLGTDNEMDKAYNVFIQRSYGAYTFASLQNFYDNVNLGAAAAKPGQFRRGLALLDGSASDNTASAADFKTLRLGFFAQDDIKVNDNLTVNVGIRADKTSFLTDIVADNFFNDTALAIVSQYYDLKGARSGQKPTIPWSLSPRLGFTYKIPEDNLVVRGGIGLFSGRIPLVWPGGIYNNNGVAVGAITVSNPNIQFNANPFGQPDAAFFGLNPNRDTKGSLNLISKTFKLPKLFRTSLAVDKKLGNGWSTSLELLVSKNMNEIDYKNVALQLPQFRLSGPDNRYIYDTTNTIYNTSTGAVITAPNVKTALIPLRSSGTLAQKTPYDNILVLTNNNNAKGFSYNFTFTIDKAWKNGFAFNANYAYGNSQVLNEATSSVNTSQWQFMETVNGRNNNVLSTSDFDLGHRVTGYIAKKFTYANKKLSTTITFTYQGQSGQPFSYVYKGTSIVTDNGRTDANELLFIPNAAQVQAMLFDQTGITVTQQQQRDLLESYLSNDKYLSKHRGQYADRNGARLPFTNLVNFKLQQDLTLKLGGRNYGVQLSYDVFNFANMIDHNAGRQYFLSNDNFGLIEFRNFASTVPGNANYLVPIYRFTGVTTNGGKPYGLSTSTSPDYSARWISSVTARVNF
ncbi:MAG: TonB-dependent receptor [Ferruginibacter sp.]